MSDEQHEAAAERALAHASDGVDDITPAQDRIEGARGDRRAYGAHGAPGALAHRPRATAACPRARAHRRQQARRKRPPATTAPIHGTRPKSSAPQRFRQESEGRPRQLHPRP